MKKIFVGILLTIGSTVYAADTYVNGYTRDNGTYVQPHYRSAPDSDRSNNWSTSGNTNPYTGTSGTRNSSTSYSPNSNNSRFKSGRTEVLGTSDQPLGNSYGD